MREKVDAQCEHLLNTLKALGLRPGEGGLKETNNAKFWCIVKKLEPSHSVDGSAKWCSCLPQGWQFL